jgi:ZIP family zinc transporter
MSNLISPPLVCALILAAIMIAAGVASIFLRPGKTLCTVILHFAGGMVFAVVAVELYPFLRDQKGVLPEAIGFIGGIAILLALRALTHYAVWKKQESSVTTPLPFNVLIETGENIVLDGFAISIAFAAAARAGVLLTIALAVEALSLGIGAASRFSKSSRATRIALLFFLGSGYVFASGAGMIALPHLSDVAVAMALSFVSAALFFLAAEEILVEAREIRSTPSRAAAFFGGYVVLLLLDSVLSGVF